MSWRCRRSRWASRHVVATTTTARAPAARQPSTANANCTAQIGVDGADHRAGRADRRRAAELRQARGRAGQREEQDEDLGRRGRHAARPRPGDDGCPAVRGRTTRSSPSSGPPAARRSAPIGSQITRAGLAAVAGSATATDLTEKGTFPTFFRVVPRDDVQGPQDAQYVVDNLKPKAVMLVDDQTSYSTGLADAMAPVLEKAGRQGRPRVGQPEADRLLVAREQGHRRHRRRDPSLAGRGQRAAVRPAPRRAEQEGDHLRHRRPLLARPVQDPGLLRVLVRARHHRRPGRRGDRQGRQGEVRRRSARSARGPTRRRTSSTRRSRPSARRARTPSRENVLDADQEDRPARVDPRPADQVRREGRPDRREVLMFQSRTSYELVGARRSDGPPTRWRAASRAEAWTWTSSSSRSSTASPLGSVYALIALGYSMVYGVLKLLNFAHGDVYMIGAFVGYCVLTVFGGPPRSILPVPLAVAAHVRRGGARRRARWAWRSSASRTGRCATRRGSRR